MYIIVTHVTVYINLSKKCSGKKCKIAVFDLNKVNTHLNQEQFFKN